MRLAALIVLLLAASARGVPEGPLQRIDAIQNRAVSQAATIIVLQEQVRQIQKDLTAARFENINQNAAFRAEKDTLEGMIRQQKKTLNSPWVQAALWARRLCYWLVGGYVALGVLAIIGGSFGAPAGAMAKLSSAIIRGLPLGNWVRWAIDLTNPTTRVAARETPIVTSPVDIVPNPDNAVAAARLRAMDNPGPPTPPVDFSSNVPGFGVRR